MSCALSFDWKTNKRNNHYCEVAQYLKNKNILVQRIWAKFKPSIKLSRDEIPKARKNLSSWLATAVHSYDVHPDAIVSSALIDAGNALDRYRKAHIWLSESTLNKLDVLCSCLASYKIDSPPTVCKEPERLHEVRHKDEDYLEMFLRSTQRG